MIDFKKVYIELKDIEDSLNTANTPIIHHRPIVNELETPEETPKTQPFNLPKINMNKTPKRILTTNSKQNSHRKVQSLDFESPRNFLKTVQTVRKKYNLKPPSRPLPTLSKPPLPIHPKFYKHYKARIVPELSRKDPNNFPPEITEQDINEGMLKMLYKGMIPHDADLSPAFQRNMPPLEFKQARLHSPSEMSSPPVTFRTDLTRKRDDFMTTTYRKEESQPYFEAIGDPQDFHVKVVEEKKGPYDYFPIDFKRGKLVKNNYYDDLKEKYFANWGIVRETLKRLEQYCKLKRIGKLRVDGKKLYETIVDEVNTVYLRELQHTIMNIEEYENYKAPKMLYRGKGGRQLAAVKLQAAWRRYSNFKDYKCLLALNRKASVIQSHFRLYLEKLETKRKIQSVKNSRADRYRKRQEQFGKDWEEIRKSERLEIHLACRLPDDYSMNYYTSENHEISRVCRVYDPLISVIYVTPVELHHEVVHYYHLFLERCNVEKPSEKITFITPDHKLPIENVEYATSTLLNFSFKTLIELKELIKDKIVYLVPGEFSESDINIADELNIPILAPDLETISRTNTKLGSREVFEEAGVEVPLLSGPLIDKEQFFDVFCDMVVSNIQVDHWILKINTMKESRGLAHISLGNIKMIKDLRKQYDEIDSKMAKSLKKELINKTANLIEFAQPIWRDFDDYLEAFLSLDGRIQASPVSQAISSPCISLLIEPNGEARYIGSVDRLQSREYLDIGFLSPQASVAQEEIVLLSNKIVNTLYSQRVTGFITIELLAFSDSESVEGPKVWGIDLHIGLDKISCGLMLYFSLLGGDLDMASGKYFIVFDEDEEEFSLIEDVFGDDFTNMLTIANRKSTRSETKVFPELLEDYSDIERPNYEDFNMYDERTCVYIWHAEHPEIGELSLGAFLHMCRLETAIYHLANSKGSVFNFYDTPAVTYLGILSIGNLVKDSIENLVEIFSFLLEQAGPPPEPKYECADPPKEYYNFTDIITEIKEKLMSLEKEGKKNRGQGFMMDLN